MAPPKRVETFEGFFEVAFLTLRLAGWRPVQATAPKWYKFFCWISFGVIVLSNLNGFLNLISIFGDKGKFLLITESAMLSAFGVLSIVKVFAIVFVNRNETADILNQMEEYLRESETKIAKDEIQQKVRKFVTFWRGASASYFFGISALILKPLVAMLYNLIINNVFRFKIPVMSWYPFEDSCWLAWILVYMLQIWSLCLTALFAVGVDSMFCATVLITCWKFSELEREVQTAETYKELTKCIANHLDLIEMSERLSRIHQPVIFCNFFIASLGVCLSGFQSTAVGQAEFMLYVYSGIWSMLQCLTICHFADLLRESSSNVAEAAYQNDWSNKDRKMKKQILMIMMRAQRPQHFKAFLFGKVTMMVFTAIINASYSYYALLQTLVEKK